MRPKQIVYTLAALSATGHATGLTGTGPFTTFTAAGTGDDTGHQTTLTSAANLSGITMVIVGTDAQGNVQTESIAGPNANTINLVKYYKTFTRITASATLGANTMNVGWTALVQTPIIPCDFAKLTGPMVIVGVGGTITFTAQQTNTDVFNAALTPTWATLGTAAATATATTQALSGTTGVRVTVASHTSGVLALSVSQARS